MPPTTLSARARLVARRLAFALSAASALADPARGELAAEPLGQVASLGALTSPHRVWLSDLLLRRSALFDLDRGAMLGQVSSGAGFAISPHPSIDGRELYLASTFYSRATRGERTDVVTIFDGATLQPVHEIVIPAKRADPGSGCATSTLSDDGRFLAVANMTPATSLSIVDVQRRRFSAEIETPGCALAFAAGPRRFFSLCGDGTALVIELDEEGRERTKSRSEPFFDAGPDPVIEKGVRHGDVWLFASFEGQLRGLDFVGATPKSVVPWSLFAQDDQQAGWRVGGMQPLALHEASGRLYALVHQGGRHTHKAPGSEIWVYDVATHARVRRIPVRNPNAAFLRGVLELDESRLVHRSISWLMERVLPNPGVERVAVSRDASPLLVTTTAFPSTLSVYDARSGEPLREVSEPGIASSLLVAP